MGNSTKFFKKYLPQYYIDFHGIGANFLVNSYLMNVEILRFRSYMDNFIRAHIRQDSLNQLNMPVDPWDNYDYHDSKIIFEMILGTKSKKDISELVDQINLLSSAQNQLDKDIRKSGKEKFLVNYLIIKFVDYLLEHDMHNQISAKGEKLVDQLIIFITKKENEEDLINIIEMLKFIEDRNKLDESTANLNEEKSLEETKYEDFEKRIYLTFDKYISLLKQEGVFSETKNDYFV
jgi:hypothetical protein